MSFTRSMAAEFAGDGIRVNAIAPGPVDTDMMRKNPQQAIDHMVGATLMKRLATPDEMVGCCAAAVFGCRELPHRHGRHRRWRAGRLAEFDRPSAHCLPPLRRVCVSVHDAPQDFGSSRTLVRPKRVVRLRMRGLRSPIPRRHGRTEHPDPAATAAAPNPAAPSRPTAPRSTTPTAGPTTATPTSTKKPWPAAPRTARTRTDTTATRTWVQDEGDGRWPLGESAWPSTVESTSRAAISLGFYHRVPWRRARGKTPRPNSTRPRWRRPRRSWVGPLAMGVPPPWHDRPFVLVAASLVGVVGLIALALSVVDMSADSTHPAHAPASAVSTTTTPAPQPTNPTTVVASSEPSSLPSPTSVPDFAAGPTAEMEIPPTAAPPAAAAPFRLPRWLRRLLHQGDAPD